MKRRDTPTLHGFIIPHLASARSVVVSDCWGAYNGLDQVCRHYSVNHSKEFVNEKGYHTNGAESVHNTIKYWVRLDLLIQINSLAQEINKKHEILVVKVRAHCGNSRMNMWTKLQRKVQHLSL